MADIYRVNTSWSNFPGAPGISSIYSLTQPSASGLTDIRSFFSAFSTIIPAGATLQVEGEGDIINDATGTLTGAWSATQPAAINCSGAGNYSGSTGAVVHWFTNGVVRGRRVRGRTFLVPLVASAYDTNGSLSSSAISSITTAADGLIAAAGITPAVWSRPTGFASGAAFEVVSSRVPDLAVVLRSRRS